VEQQYKVRNMDLTVENATLNLRTTRFYTQKCYVMHKVYILVLFIYISVSKTFFFSRTLLASKNNHGSSLYYSRKYKLSGCVSRITNV